MSNPWDRPPFPSDGDEDIGALYRSVGRVTSEWEGVEVGMSRIYSFFVERPDDRETIREYGEGHRFVDRVKEFGAVAREFFIRHCDQVLEGDFDSLRERAEGFSNRRNDVAHGIVTAIHHYDWYKARAAIIKPRTAYWAVLPTYHDYRKHHADGTPHFAYTSAELEVICAHLSKLYGDLGNYRERLRMLLGARR